MTTDNDLQDVIVETVEEMLDNACKIVAISKEKQSNIQSIVYVDEEGNDRAIQVYDFKIHRWKSTDTFDRLAADFLGNANMGTVLAYYNGIAYESGVEAGTKIKIPQFSETSASSRNRIYAEPEKQDNYGIDIALDDEGDFAVRNGDFAVVGGRENLSQALAMRLTTASRKRIRLAAYGIRSSVGDSMALESYLLGSIEQTIMADPRVKSLENIAFSGNKDKLHLSFVYTDINGSTNNYEGDI